MLTMLANPFRGIGLPDAERLPLDDATPVSKLLSQCPVHAPTPWINATDLARECEIAALWIKDERARMGLGSFKALGAAHAIARAASATGDPGANSLTGQTYVTASAGNHGLSVAAGASVFGARAVVYLAETVPEAFAERLRAKGAEVVRAGTTYEDSMAAAEAAAKSNGWSLLSDSSWPGYSEMPLRVMEGYLQMAAEAVAQVPQPPTHILLQAGVGGLAAAFAAHARRAWGDGPHIIVVEPAAAPALIESIRAGKIVDTTGPVSNMGRLDCKTPSQIALAGLARDADTFVTIAEEDAEAALPRLAEQGLASTPSGAAGLVALFSGLPMIDADARVLAILSEGPEDA